MSQLQDLLCSEQASWVFDHNITWEDDVWKADYFDVEDVHRPARKQYLDLLFAITEGASVQSRILMFQGQSGAGKTHLIRALRSYSHCADKGYFGYAQMTPDVKNYAEYYLRRLINSLEKPYSPITRSENSLTRLSHELVADAQSVTSEDLEALREADLSDKELGRLVSTMADAIVASEKFCDQDIDINIVRALLYIQRNDPRIDQRVRQYLYGRPLNTLSAENVSALDPNQGEDRAFEIIESLGKIMWITGQAALVFCIDQVEDLRFFDDAEERFQKAIRDLIQIANRVPSGIILISCLDDFYFQMRDYLPQSFIDRIEKGGPMVLRESRTEQEARMIIERRLRHILASAYEDPDQLTVEDFFGSHFLSEVAGLSTRRLLEAAEIKRRELCHVSQAKAEEPKPASQKIEQNETYVAKAQHNVSHIAQDSIEQSSDTPIHEPVLQTGHEAQAEDQQIAAVISTSSSEELNPEQILVQSNQINAIQHAWERFISSYEAEIPEDEDELGSILYAALILSREEGLGDASVNIEQAWLEGLCALDLRIEYPDVPSVETRLFVCNRGSQGGGLKRQLEKVMNSREEKQSVIIRAADFPPNPKSTPNKILRQFKKEGGRVFVIPIYEWERMVTLHAFCETHRRMEGFADWMKAAGILRDLPALRYVLRLDLMEPLPSLSSNKRNGFGLPPRTTSTTTGAATVAATGNVHHLDFSNRNISSQQMNGQIGHNHSVVTAHENDEPETVYFHDADPVQSDIEDELDYQLSLNMLDSTAIAGRDEIKMGQVLNKVPEPVIFPVNTLKRHAAFLGGSGSGKTTLALTIIEQLLDRDLPVILIDRKGDLCSYANPDVWKDDPTLSEERREIRRKLRERLDVAVYTPGRISGRPISITLMPNGVADLPPHEQQQLANMSAAALSDMLHLGNSATHQRQGGILTVALRLLGSISAREVTLADLISLLEDDHSEVVDETYRMDPSGKLRRDLVAQLDSLRHRNWALFEGGGEPLSMDSLLGLGRFAKPGKTRLSIIYTGFLGDNENILFWVAQFLSEALRFCQRNPNDDLQAVIMFDEADMYIPANSKPATKEPLESLLKRARSAGIGLMLATQSPGDLDYKSRDQITSWFIGKVREDTALRKLKAAFSSDTGIDPAVALPNQRVGQFHLIQEGIVKPMMADRSLIKADQVPFDRIEELASETAGQAGVVKKSQLALDLG